MKDYGFILSNRPFGRLWAAQMLSATAQHLLNFALILAVYNLAAHTRYANVAVGLYVLAYGVPSILFASVAGVYIDHWNCRIVMLVTNGIRALLALGYLLADHSLAHIFALSFVIASITQFFIPAEAASIPKVVEKPNLLAANSLFVLSFYATFILGYSASAPLVKLLGAHAPFYLAAGMFGVAAWCSYGLPPLKVIRHQHQTLQQIIRSTHHELQANWRAITSQASLYFPITHLVMVQAVLGTVLTLAPALAAKLLGAPLPDVSQFLIIPAGLGMVIGVVLVGRLTAKHSAEQGVKVSALSAAVALALMGAVRAIVDRSMISLLTGRLVVAGLVFGLGFANAVMTTLAQTLLQHNSSEASRGKIFGALNMLMNVAATLPVLIAASLADIFGVIRVISGIGIALTIGAIVQIVGPWYFSAKKA